jgi:hypothetical protein
MKDHTFTLEDENQLQGELHELVENNKVSLCLLVHFIIIVYRLYQKTLTLGDLTYGYI